MADGAACLPSCSVRSWVQLRETRSCGSDLLQVTDGSSPFAKLLVRPQGRKLTSMSLSQPPRRARLPARLQTRWRPRSSSDYDLRLSRDSSETSIELPEPRASSSSSREHRASQAPRIENSEACDNYPVRRGPRARILGVGRARKGEGSGGVRGGRARGGRRVFDVGSSSRSAHRLVPMLSCTQLPTVSQSVLVA